MDRKESKGFVQLEWVCPNCDTHNPGPVKTCRNCGAPQPENVQFQRAAEEKILTDEKSIQAAKAGADIHCGFCGTRNPATAVSCSQCGADLKEGKARQSGQALQAAPAAPKSLNCTNCGNENPGTARVCSKCGAPLARPAAPVPPQTPPPAARGSAPAAAGKKPNMLLLGGIGAFLLICCIAIFAMFIIPTKSVQGTVTNVHWQTSVPVEEQKPVHYSDKSGSPPSGAYDVSCHDDSKEVCEEKSIDKGNGYAEVVKECHTETTTYCDYTVDEWKTIQTYTLEGTDFSPVYDTPSLASGQREGSQSEIFTVYFDTANGQLNYSPGSLTDFQQYTIGSVWKIKLNALGGVVSVKP